MTHDAVGAIKNPKARPLSPFLIKTGQINKLLIWARVGISYAPRIQISTQLLAALISRVRCVRLKHDRSEQENRLSVPLPSRKERRCQSGLRGFMRSTEMSTFPARNQAKTNGKIHQFRRLARRVSRVEDPCLAPLPDSTTSRQINPPPTTTRYGQCARDGASSSVLFA